MANWNDLKNKGLGSVIGASQWNTIFGPDGNMQYLKDRADQITFNNYNNYSTGKIRVPFGWPQPNVNDVSIKGTVIYPTWKVSGIPQKEYITLDGPAKYLCLLQIHGDLNYLRRNGDIFRYSTIKTIVTDTNGNLNFTHLQQTGYPLNTTLNFYDTLTQDVKYQVPFIFDAPYDSDLLVGFVCQRNFQESLSVDNYDLSKIYYFSIDCNLTIVKLSSYREPAEVSTSFILNTTTLDGSSSF